MFLNVSATSWIEDPSPLIAALQDAVAQPERDPVCGPRGARAGA